MFKIKAYGKSELAMLYFPNSDPHVATNRLRNWINRCQELSIKTNACNNSRFAKFYSAEQVRLIIKYLGEP